MGGIVPIVEGDGEVDALPNLIYKFLLKHNCHILHIARPLNAHGSGNITRPDGVERFVKLALGKSNCQGILVLLDADESCAYELAHSLAVLIAAINPRKPVCVVCAKCEYEA